MIDLAAICGLYPLEPEFVQYFRESRYDRPHTAYEAADAEAGSPVGLEHHDLLHPDTKGQLRMAYALAYQLLGYPARFE